MPPISLIPHSSTPCASLRRVAVRVRRARGVMLALVYTLEGAIAGLRLPAPGPPSRADELWRHTCFEAFLTGRGLTGYYEFNFAPSTEWALYHFAAYREGMSVVEEADGRHSYWSLRHPPGRPDFHHPDGFALALDGAEPALNLARSPSF